MVVVDPRRTETAKAAHEHHFVRPGTDAFVLLAMLQVLFAEGLTTPPAYVDGLDAVRAAVEPFTPERAEAASAASPRTSYAGWRGSSRRAESAAVYGRVGVSTQEFGLVATWAVQLLNLVTGNLDRPGGVMLTRPAVDAVGRGLIGRGPPRRVAQPGPRPAGVRRRAAGRDAGRRDPHPGRGPGAGAAHRGRQPGLLDPGRRAAGRGDRAAWTSWRRSTSTSTRPPGTPT